MGGTASDYAIRSKAAVLLALVTKRQGGQLLQALLPELLRLAGEGPTQAEMVRHVACCNSWLSWLSQLNLECAGYGCNVRICSVDAIVCETCNQCMPYSCFQALPKHGTNRLQTRSESRHQKSDSSSAACSTCSVANDWQMTETC